MNRLRSLLAPALVVLLLVMTVLAPVDGYVLCIETGESAHVALEFGHCEDDAPCADRDEHGCESVATLHENCHGCRDLPLSGGTGDASAAGRAFTASPFVPAAAAFAVLPQAAACATLAPRPVAGSAAAAQRLVPLLI